MVFVELAKKVKPHVKLYEEKMGAGDYVGIKNDKVYKVSTRVKYHFNPKSGEVEDVEYHPEDLLRIYGIVSNKYNYEEQSNIVPIMVLKRVEEPNEGQ